jgi:hypothetical protein
MANFGKRPINDAGHAQQTRAPVAFIHAGEQRLDRRPYGHIERFVDPVGNVITLQLSTPGDPKSSQTSMRVRAEKHADGWIEHAKCPLRHGHHNLSPALSREFEKRPTSIREQCAADPRVMSKKDGELHANESCPHVEWLIASRRKTEADQNRKRNSARVAEEKRKEEAAELQAAQLEMVKEQIEERKTRKKAKAE